MGGVRCGGSPSTSLVVTRQLHSLQLLVLCSTLLNSLAFHFFWRNQLFHLHSLLTRPSQYHQIGTASLQLQHHGSYRPACLPYRRDNQHYPSSLPPRLRHGHTRFSLSYYQGNDWPPPCPAQTPWDPHRHQPQFWSVPRTQRIHELAPKQDTGWGHLSCSGSGLNDSSSRPPLYRCGRRGLPCDKRELEAPHEQGSPAPEDRGLTWGCSVPCCRSCLTRPSMEAGWLGCCLIMWLTLNGYRRGYGRNCGIFHLWVGSAQGPVQELVRLACPRSVQQEVLWILAAGLGPAHIIWAGQSVQLVWEGKISNA